MKSVLLTFLLGFSILSWGQFSADPEQFLKDIDKQLGAIDRQKTKAFLEEFEPNWLSNFSASNQSRVVATCNLIKEKRLSNFPDVYGYLLSVHSFIKTNQPVESFESFHNTIDQLLNSKKSGKFETFIQVCAGFFTDGTVFDYGNHLWKVRDGNYKFQFNKGTPMIQFSNVTLGCYIVNRSAGKKDDPYYDSTVVRGTSGLLEPLTNKWTGRGGIVDWAKVGLEPKGNFAQITDYILSLKQTQIESDSATMYTQYYDEPLVGKFSDQAKKINREVDRTSPAFVSFSKQVVRKDILPEVDYVGGFAIEGAYFHGVGYPEEPASLVFYQEGKPFVKASAQKFKVNNEGVRADECKVVLYMTDTDTLYHPGLNLRYDLKSMEMARGTEGLSQAPFGNSYHGLDMYIDKVVWRRDDPNLTFEWQFGSTKKLAIFESQNYFSERVYNQIQGMNKIHPLAAIYGHAYKYDIEVIKLGECATAMNYTVEQAIPIILDLANQGFLIYDKHKKTVKPLPKMKKYLDARAGNSDYDHVVFHSNLLEIAKKSETTPDGRQDKEAIHWNYRADSLNRRKSEVENFGSLNLKTMDLVLNEVDPIEISPNRHVVIFPNENGVVVKENLDFLFHGAVMAGKTEFYLDEASFDYEKFQINLMECSAALLRVAPIFGGSDRLVPMYSHFEGLKGVVKIDDPSNRSGVKLKRYHQYPILESKKESYVFYDHKSIYGGVYDSARFYFKVDEFVFDSLTNYKEEAVAFDGEMRSAGIFPVFREKLRIQEDYSFGFKTKAPAGGFDFYGEGAKFDNEIRLSNQGLQGAGDIDFQTSHSESNDWIFFPDSTMGIAKYSNKPQGKDMGISVPDVVCDGAMVTYVPKEQVLKARAVKAPLFFWDKEVDMRGITYLTPKGMTGRGLMYFKEAELGSKKFEYSRWLIEADTADFNLMAKGVGDEVDEFGKQNPLSFNTTNVQAKIDFQERKGDFKSNEGESKVEFPKNQYICYMDMFTWFMDKDEMELSKQDLEINTDLDLAGSNFFSVHPDQDSLNFAAPKAKFDLNKHILFCEEVPFLDIADARIVTADSKLIIRKRAKMDPFDGATITANNVTKYHTIQEAHVQINARKSYNASGYYEYKDSKEEVQKIFFGDIHPDTLFRTVAIGDIEEDRGFYLSDKFEFYGKAELMAANQFLTFDGATRIKHDCNQFARNWLKFRAEIDPNNIQIPVDEDMKDLDGNSIAVGLVLRKNTVIDSLGVYPAFLSALERRDDENIFTSYGVLNFNEAAGEYRIASPEKLINRAEVGNYIALHLASCSMEGDGKIDLQLGLPDVDFTAYGTVAYDNATKETRMNISGGLDFFYDKKAMTTMSNKILATEGISGIDFGRTSIEQAIREEASKEEAENIKSDYTIKGAVKKLPKQMEDPLYLTNIRLKWDDRAKGFISQTISGVAGCYGDAVMKDFTVRMAIEYTVAGDRGPRTGVLIELPDVEGKQGDYYFYRFEKIKKDTKLSVITSDTELQTYLGTLKDDKMKKGKFMFELKGDKSGVFRAKFKSWWDE